MISKLKLFHYIRLLKGNVHPKSLNLDKMIKYLNYAGYKLSSFNPRMNMDLAAPVYTSLVVTKRCNLSCDFCVVARMLGDEKKQFELTTSRAEEIYSHPMIKRSLMMMLTGGEPLLNKDLLDIIRLGKKHGHIMAVTTNGTLLHRKINDLVDAGIDSISVSVYESNFRILEKNLKKSTSQFPVRLNRVFMRSDVEKTPEAVEKAARLAVDTGCYGIIFQNLMPGSPEERDEVIYTDNRCYRDLKKAINRKYGKKLHINWSGEAPEAVRGKGDKVCRQPWYLTVIDARGNLGLCCRHQGPEYGNIFGQGRGDVKNTPYWQGIRRMLTADSPALPDECRDCYLLSDTLSSDV